MAQPFLAAIRDNLLVRASVATVAGFVLLGVASGALPLTCFTGLAACPSVDTSTKPAETIATKPAAAATATPKIVQVAVNETASPTLTSNDVIAGTFATLQVDLQELQPGELTKRKVKTVAIGPDGQPIGATPAAAPAEPTPAPSSAEEVKTAEAAPAAPAVTRTEPAPKKLFIKPLFPETAEQSPAPLAYAATTPAPARQSSAEAATTEIASAADQPDPPKAKTSGKKATVKGSGVNVRSSPSKGKSKVLFALAPGASVTVTDSQRGWLKVTDGKGRSGWVYQDFVTRQ